MKWNTTLSKFPSSQKTVTIVAKGDSGTSCNYIWPQNTHIFLNIILHNDPGVFLPNNKNIASLHKGNLPLLKRLSTKAKKSIILPDLSNASLVLLEQS